MCDCHCLIEISLSQLGLRERTPHCTSTQVLLAVNTHEFYITLFRWEKHHTVQGYMGIFLFHLLRSEVYTFIRRNIMHFRRNCVISITFAAVKISSISKLDVASSQVQSLGCALSRRSPVEHACEAAGLVVLHGGTRCAMGRPSIRETAAPKGGLYASAPPGPCRCTHTLRLLQL